MRPQHSGTGSVYGELMRRLTVPAVRDLAWAIGSPGLLDPGYPAFGGQVVTDAWCEAALAAAAERLLALDRNPSPLHDFLTVRPLRRLGRYFELLVEFWLAGADELRLLVAHLPVRRDKLTLGEFDFLLEEHDGRRVHWETAVKLYLHAEPGEAWDTFLGPSTVDRLDIKLGRVFTHQLKLRELPEARLVYAEAPTLCPQAFLKGYLFYPPGSEAAGAGPGVSPGHLRGWWRRLGEGDWPRANVGSRFRLLPRLQWLAPCRAETAEALWDAERAHQEVSALLTAKPEPLMVAELLPSGGAWHEVARGFVVPARWPEGEGTPAGGLGCQPSI